MDTNIAIIENIKYENDYVVFKGYALNRLIDSDDNIEKQLIKRIDFSVIKSF